MKSLNPDIYRKAANLIFEGSEEYACHAITTVENISSFGESSHKRLFLDIFDPRDGNHAFFGPVSDKQTQLARQLALLLTAEIVEEGNL